MKTSLSAARALEVLLKRKEQSGYREIYAERYYCKISLSFVSNTSTLYSIKGDKFIFYPQNINACETRNLTKSIRW